MILVREVQGLSELSGSRGTFSFLDEFIFSPSTFHLPSP